MRLWTLFFWKLNWNATLLAGESSSSSSSCLIQVHVLPEEHLNWHDMHATLQLRVMHGSWISFVIVAIRERWQNTQIPFLSTKLQITQTILKNPHQNSELALFEVKNSWFLLALSRQRLFLLKLERWNIIIQC